VPNDNPLLFYDAIARFAQKHLNPNGKLWVETAENEAQAVAQLFAAHKFERVIVRRDINGKERVVSAFLPPAPEWGDREY
jgi:release factor glutamine methyltransferase